MRIDSTVMKPIISGAVILFCLFVYFCTIYTLWSFFFPVVFCSFNFLLDTQSTPILLKCHKCRRKHG